MTYKAAMSPISVLKKLAAKSPIDGLLLGSLILNLNVESSADLARHPVHLKPASVLVARRHKYSPYK